MSHHMLFTSRYLNFTPKFNTNLMGRAQISFSIFDIFETNEQSAYDDLK